MPIDVDSEEWKEGRRLDPLEVHITDFLRNNDEQAFTLEEITDRTVINNTRTPDQKRTGRELRNRTLRYVRGLSGRRNL